MYNFLQLTLLPLARLLTTFLNFLIITGIHIHLQDQSVKIYESLKMPTCMWRDKEQKETALLKILVLLISSCFLNVKTEQFKCNKYTFLT